MPTWEETLQRHYLGRHRDDKVVRAACYAPYTSMYFDVHGNVTACCWSKSYPLGNITKQSLREIWDGARVRAMRRALAEDNFQVGCQFCEWQLKHGGVSHMIPAFDRYPVANAEPEYPAQMDFSIGNVCNLECQMCNGEWSSLIRKRREKLPPLPRVYGDAFFDELFEFLPHLRAARFYGGEPLLDPGCGRIFDMLVDMGLTPNTEITTNATTLNPRIERLLERIPSNIAVSIDGCTKETYERIRINANFEEVLANIDWFQAYTRRHGTYFGFAFCLIQQNLHEFADFLLFAEGRGAPVTVNTVASPPSCSIYQMPLNDLAKDLEQLKSHDKELNERLTLNLAAWKGELERIERHLRRPIDIQLQVLDLKETPTLARLAPRATPDRRGAERAALDRAYIERYFPAGRREELLFGADGRAIVDEPHGVFLGAPLAGLAGLSAEQANDQLLNTGVVRLKCEPRRVLGRPSVAVTRCVVDRSSGEQWIAWIAATPEEIANGAGMGSVNFAVAARAASNDANRGAELFPPHLTVDALRDSRRLHDFAATALAQWSGRTPDQLDFDRDDTLIAIKSDDGGVLGPSAERHIGRRSDDLFGVIIERFGGVKDIAEAKALEMEERWLRLDRDGRTVHVAALLLPRWSDDGEVVGTRILAAWAESATESDRVIPQWEKRVARESTNAGAGSPR